MNFTNRQTRRAAHRQERPTPARKVSAPPQQESPQQTAFASGPRVHSRAVTASTSGLAALLVACGLVLTQGLPAPAFETEFTPDAVAAPVPQLQSIVVTGQTVPTARDAFTITAPPPPPPAPRSNGSARAAFANSTASAVQWPFASSPISSDFGPRSAPCSSCSSFHKGLDFTPGAGTPVAAVAAGTVRQVNRESGGLGTHVIIDHQIDGVLVSTVYAHMQAGSVALSNGQAVAVGAKVGLVGNTGASTGAHLHLEVHENGVQVDPFAWLSSHVR